MRLVYQDGVDQGWLLDLTPFIESERGFEADDFHAGVLALDRQDRRTWAIPVGVMFYGLVYRPDLFREVGISLPGSEWTWADLFEAARRIAGSSSAEEERYSFYDPGEMHSLAMNWLAERSGGFYQEKDGSLVPALDRPARGGSVGRPATAWGIFVLCGAQPDMMTFL